MKRVQSWFWLMAMVSFLAAPTLAQERLYIAGGIQETKLLGTGNENNEFTFGLGYALEFGIYNLEPGFSWAIYGLSGSSHKNRVKDSETEATCFAPYYTEFRLRLKEGQPFFCSVGFDWNRMHFAKTEGADNQYFYSVGFGAAIPLKSILLLSKIKPYLVTSNSLGQSFGVSFQLQVGVYLGQGQQ